MMVREAVKVAHSPRTTRLLIDPAMREIFRQLTIESQTSTQLPEKMDLMNSTVGHHLARNVYTGNSSESIVQWALFIPENLARSPSGFQSHA